MNSDHVRSEAETKTPSAPPADETRTTRRGFLAGVGATAAAAAVGGQLGLAPRRAAAGQGGDHTVIPPDNARLATGLDIRVSVAEATLTQPAPPHPTNGDDYRYADDNYIGSYSKALPHNDLGEVDPDAYRTLLAAIRSRRFADFDKVPLGNPGITKLVNPIAGVDYDMEGKDQSQFVLGPPPALASSTEAAEAIELYWMALLRDVNFYDYPSNPGVAEAADELTGLPAFTGPRVNGKVTPQTLFRDSWPGVTTGPFVSQFLIRDFRQGAQHVVRRINTTLPRSDYGTTFPEFLLIQNGGIRPTDTEQSNPELIGNDPIARYIRNGRDLSIYVHVDSKAQATWEAANILLQINAPLSPTNPYLNSKTQIGFVTFDLGHYFSLLYEACMRALKAAWYQKWFVHRRLRPEAYGGLVQNVLTDKADYPLNDDILNSEAVGQVHSRYGSYLLPQAYREGSPAHPSYPSGHATWIGASVTILKAFFDESYVLPRNVQPNPSGTALVPYDGAALTVGGELNKLAMNVAAGRNFAGIHWLSDEHDGNLLGEAVAVALLRYQKPTFLEPATWRFTGFRGNIIEI